MKTNAATIVCVFALFVLGFAAVAYLAMADPNAPTSLNPISSTNRNLSTLAAQSANAQGGNVTEININTLTITKSWQGYYGNVSGIVTLQNGNGFTFYNWTTTTKSGRVFATRNQTVTWSTVNCTNSTQRPLEEAYLNQSSGDSDSVTNTFSLTSHPSFVVAGRTITPNSCYSTNGFVANASQTANFYMVLLSDVYNNTIYTALMNSSVTGFDSQQHDFELLVGENEKTGYVGVTPYYFWTEFN